VLKNECRRQKKPVSSNGEQAFIWHGPVSMDILYESKKHPEREILFPGALIS